MALTSKKYSAIHTKTGSDLTSMQDKFDNAKHLNIVNFEPEAAIIYQIQKMQDELDYLRTEISSNKSKSTFPGFGTTSTTAMAGDTTTISTAQARAITNNTAKTSMTLGTSSTTALAGDTNIVTIGSSTTIAFGDMVTLTDKNGRVTGYNIVMTVTNGGVSKSITLTLT